VILGLKWRVKSIGGRSGGRIVFNVGGGCGMDVCGSVGMESRRDCNGDR
jgi:hypothetical protein